MTSILELSEKSPGLIKELHFEVYQLVRLGLNHSALSMMSVLLEATLKEAIKKKRGKYPKGASFKKSISICLYEKLLSKKESEWLGRINELVRNSYVHHDVERLAKNMKISADKISGKSKRDFDRLVAIELFADINKFLNEFVSRIF